MSPKSGGITAEVRSAREEWKPFGVARPCELDPTNPDHVSAVHEAGHAVAMDRSGCVIRTLHLVKGEKDRSHGTTGRHNLDGVEKAEIVRRDRVIALAGPEAERRFSGEVDNDACENDEQAATAATAMVGDDLDAVRADVAAALANEDVWFAVEATAYTILACEGFIANPPRLQMEGIRQVLGAPICLGRHRSHLSRRDLPGPSSTIGSRVCSRRRRRPGRRAAWRRRSPACIWPLSFKSTDLLSRTQRQACEAHPSQQSARRVLGAQFPPTLPVGVSRHGVTRRLAGGQTGTAASFVPRSPCGRMTGMPTIDRTTLSCALCGQWPSSRVGEHVLPNWLLRKLFPVGEYSTYVGGALETQTPNIPRLQLPVCDQLTGGGCNKILSDRFERRETQDAVLKLIEGTVVTERETEAAGVWWLKTLLLGHHPDLTDPVGALKWEPPVDQDLFRWMVQGSAPPADISIWCSWAPLSVVSGAKQLSLYTGPRISLPCYLFEDKEFTSRVVNFGLRRLYLHLVVHPGWDVLHPFEEAGQAIRLFPWQGGDCRPSDIAEQGASDLRRWFDLWGHRIRLSLASGYDPRRHPWRLGIGWASGLRPVILPGVIGAGF